MLSMICAVLAAPSARAEVRTYLVDTTADDPGRSTCDDQTPGDCSLRGALSVANGRSGDDSTIVLPSGTYLLTTVASCVLHTGQFGAHNITATTLCISGRITIRGQQNAASVVIDGGGTGRVFVVGNDAPARIEQVTIRGGAQLGGSLYGGGGGINNAGDLTLVDAIVTANFARGGGGGIYNSGTLHIHRSRIVHNTAANAGGGVVSDSFNIPVDASITDSTIAENTSNEAQGGGIFIYGGNQGGRTEIKRSTISGNEATLSGGGGIFVAGNRSTVDVENSTISGNRAGWYYGGGLWSTGVLHRVTLRNVTVTNNRSQDASGTRGGAGGIANDEASIMTLANTIVAGNFAPDFAPDCYDGGRATTLTSEGYNIIGDQGAGGDGAGGTYCDLSTADGDQTNVDPQLEPLRDNGGLTETHGTVEGSPAIDGGAPSGCRDTEGNVLTGDQRGEPSPTDGDGDGGARCDAGSYENGGTFGVGTVDPPNGGNVGAVCAVIHGHRFAPGITVKLTKPGSPDIPGTPTSVSADGTVIATAFDLAGRAPGDYAVTVTNPGGASTTRSGAFRVDAGGAPDVWAEMIGPVALRRGRWTRFFFVYGNRGNADALGVPIQIAAAPGVGLKLNFSVGPPPANPQQAITDWSTYRTSVDGRPVTDYTIHSFILPLVPAGYTGALEFRVNLPVGGTDVQPLLVPFNGQAYARPDGPDADSDPDIDPEFVQAYVDAALAYTRDVLGVPPPSNVAFLRQYVTDQLARIVKEGIDSWFRNPGNAGGGGAGSAG
ncbi:right-handed parallel beta-helix repeat-containing protein, partial [Candidatus Binatia bacterium]|nr:right-handed parallel beta-helix repeat-containing protein [Candidatus Binatia bacterium]